MGLEQRILGAAGALFLAAAAGFAQEKPCAAETQELLRRTKEVRLAMFGGFHSKRDPQTGEIIKKDDVGNEYFISLLGDLKRGGYTAVGLEIPYAAKPAIDIYRRYLETGHGIPDPRYGELIPSLPYAKDDSLLPIIEAAASHHLEVVPIAGKEFVDKSVEHSDYDKFMRQREHEITSIISEYLHAHPDGKMAVFIGAKHITKRPIHLLYVWDFQSQEGGTVRDPQYPSFAYAAAALSKQHRVLSVDLSGGMLRQNERDVLVDFTISPACLR